MSAQCDMADDCAAPVTHIGNRGWVYCTEHAQLRRATRNEETRKMRVWELRLIESGKPLPSYTPGKKPADSTTTTNGEQA